MEEKTEKICVCIRWNPTLVAENNRVQAFETYQGKCSQCSCTVMMTGVTKKNIEDDPQTIVLCQVCTAEKFKDAEPPQIAVTGEHLREVYSFLKKREAQKN